MEELYTAYIITMKTKEGKKLYLTSDKEWSFIKDEGMWFAELEEAQNFAEEWFKSFDRYEFDKIVY